MRYSFQRKSVRVDEENPYWISFSDLMSALLVIFILATVALIIELTDKSNRIDESITQLQNAEQARKDILNEVKDELKKLNIKVYIAENDSVLRIPDTTLTFSSNSYDIPGGSEDQKTIKSIGTVIYQAINKPLNTSGDSSQRFKYLDTIFIEGHTDSLQTKKFKFGNWELSTLRANSLWKFWGQQRYASKSLGEMKNAFGQTLFSVSGYAASRRLNLVEKTSKQRKQNRRIDIRFTIKRPKITELENAKNLGVQ